MKTIEYKGEKYPEFQASGFAARFAFPFADELLKGEGFDVGCNRVEWGLPALSDGSGFSWDRYVYYIDPKIDIKYNALNLPDIPGHPLVDFIFSSHCLEHISNWVDVLEYWHSRLKDGGIVFLYLPHPSQEYWMPWNNRKHLHTFTPKMFKKYAEHCGLWKYAKITGHDLNNSFYVILQK